MVNKPAYMVYLGRTKLYLGYQNPKGYQLLSAVPEARSI